MVKVMKKTWEIGTSIDRPNQLNLDDTLQHIELQISKDLSADSN